MKAMFEFFLLKHYAKPCRKAHLIFQVVSMTTPAKFGK